MQLAAIKKSLLYAGFDAKQKKQLKVFPQIKYPFMTQKFLNGKRCKQKSWCWQLFEKLSFGFHLV